MTLRVYIGWDRRQVDAYEVARFSLARHASVALDIRPLQLGALRCYGLYWRGEDPLASTEFTYSRFLVPALCGFAGRALYCDCDFLWTGDVGEMLAAAAAAKALWCVQHDYRPPEATKMDGRPQSIYPRKNWSSLMLFECAHPAVRKLTPAVVNEASGAYLHRLQWLEDGDIGALPRTWNWLEGWDEGPALGAPKAIHFSRGGPWFRDWQHVEYAELWRAELALLRGDSGKAGGNLP
jgi:hypothetical protein